MYQPIAVTGSGTVATVNIPWPFLDRSHVKATIGTATVLFDWNSPTQIETYALIPAGAVLVISRDTPITEALVDFEDTAVLTAEDLDKANTQLRFHQEEVDSRLNSYGDFSSLAAGVAANNASAKQAAQQAATSAGTAQAYSQSASSSATAAATSASDAATRAASASIDAGTASTKAAAASASAASAATSATTATTQATSASTSATSASASATAAASSATAASTAATNAAASAAAAAAAAAPAQELIRDTIGLALVAGAGINIVVDDNADTITIINSGSGGGGSVSFSGITGDPMTNTALASLFNGNTAALTNRLRFDAAQTLTSGQKAQAVANLGLGSAALASSAAFAPATHTHAISDVTGLQAALDVKESFLTAGTSAQFYRGDKTWQTLNKAAVGLGNVDNTSDANKPISTAAQAALDAKAPLTTGISPFTGSFTFSPPDNGRYLKFTGGSGQSVTLNTTAEAGASALLVNRGSAAFTISIPSGAYVNGAATLSTSVTLAQSGRVFLFHEGGGVYTIDGTGV